MDRLLESDIPQLTPTRAFRVAKTLDVLRYQDALRTQVRRYSAWPIIHLHQSDQLGQI